MISRTGFLVGLGSLAVLSFAMMQLKNSDVKSEAALTDAQRGQKLTEEQVNGLEFKHWHEFISPDGTFKVLFPSLPQHANEKITDPKTHETKLYNMYVSEKENGTIFMISVITMLENPGAKLDEKMLSKVMNDMLEASPNSKLKKSELGKFENYKSMDFSIENDQVMIDGKGFIVDNTLYILSSVAKLPDYYRPAFDFFTNSFHLLKPAEVKEPTTPKPVEQLIQKP